MDTHVTFPCFKSPTEVRNGIMKYYSDNFFSRPDDKITLEFGENRAIIKISSPKCNATLVCTYDFNTVKRI